MKLLRHLCLFVLGVSHLSLCGLAQQPADWRPSVAEDNKAATLKDTVDFLQQILVARGRIQSQSHNPNKFVERIVLRADVPESCTLRYVEREVDTTNSNARAPFPVHQYTLEIGRIDPLSIVVKGLDIADVRSMVTGFDVELSGRNEYQMGTITGVIYSPRFDTVDSWFKELNQADFPCMPEAKRGYRSCSSQPTSEVSSQKIPFTDQEYARRFARALMHAALLCGGTKSVSPF
jgi:hypothetical protein